nr:unnamed protein product [Callosobruchus chinensis]
MASCKIALFLATVAIAMASVSCYKCYTCNSGLSGDDKECSQPPNENSTVFDCGKAIVLNGCLTLNFERSDGQKGVARTCTDISTDCYQMIGHFEKSNITIKHCHMCSKDLCNTH